MMKATIIMKTKITAFTMKKLMKAKCMNRVGLLKTIQMDLTPYTL